jgi:hypothetical protein
MRFSLDSDATDNQVRERSQTMNKTETAQHTPTPWTVEFGQVIVSEDTTLAMTAPVHNGPRVISDDECKANARHIVHCVNLHDELVQALEILTKQLNTDFDMLDDDRVTDRLTAAYLNAVDALAKAKKEIGES